MDTNKRGLILVIIGTLCCSTSPVITRFVVDLPSGQIAFFRLLFSAFFIFVLAKVSKSRLVIDSKDIIKFLYYGLVTALHFLLYIASLKYTTIAHALCIVYTSPVIIAILSALWFKEPLPGHKYVGIFVVILGIVILASFEPLLTREMIIGDILAFGSAICLSLYSIAGRKERNRYELLQYVFWVYLLASIFLLPVALSNFTVPKTFKHWIFLLLLALIPNTLGHTLYNAGLRYTHAAYANLILTQEITLGTLLGYIFLREPVGKNAIIGIAVMIFGIYQVLFDKKPGDKLKKMQEEG
ncbi:MAG: DMT family transporter [Tepidanaerobacteraceae bacterium]